MKVKIKCFFIEFLEQSFSRGGVSNEEEEFWWRRVFDAWFYSNLGYTCMSFLNESELLSSALNAYCNKYFKNTKRVG